MWEPRKKTVDFVVHWVGGKDSVVAVHYSEAVVYRNRVEDNCCVQ